MPVEQIFWLVVLIVIVILALFGLRYFLAGR